MIMNIDIARFKLFKQLLRLPKQFANAMFEKLMIILFSTSSHKYWIAYVCKSFYFYILTYITDNICVTIKKYGGLTSRHVPNQRRP